jgi:hypothetical protein
MQVSPSRSLVGTPELTVFPPDGCSGEAEEDRLSMPSPFTPVWVLTVMPFHEMLRPEGINIAVVRAEVCHSFATAGEEIEGTACLERNARIRA